jgi:2-polyprenyl-3-methyl-5-hydroxy-6-metoxy-1,4-benzoquinol methylase
VTEHNVAASRPETNSRLSLEAEIIPPGARLLAIGDTDQYLAAVLAGRGCEIVGIGGDPDPHPSVAAHYARVLTANPVGFDFASAFGADAFDVVLLADPLDALASTAKLLRSAARTLRPDGIVIASAFNARHGSYRLAGLTKGLEVGPGSGTGTASEAPTMTWPALTGLVAQADLEIAQATAVIVDPMEGRESTGSAALPDAIVEWVRDQRGAYEREYVITATRASGRAAATPITPTPAIALPVRTDPVQARPADADPIARIEAMLGTVLDAVERQTLRERDAAIGGEVTSATARRELERLAGQFERRVGQLREDAHQREVGLRRQLRAQAARELRAQRLRYEHSATWRIGRLVTAPLRAIKRMVHRR